MPIVALATLLTVLGGGTVDVSSREALPKGTLVENVASRSGNSQRFTIYLPTSYDPARPAAVLYLMDPRGRARVAAKLFQPAAERYGYIIVSSHNTASDGPAEVNLQAMQAMWDDSHEGFAIDGRRVYVAGFSGTARVATLMARHMSSSITGVIGSAAAYHPDVRPAKETPFLYFGSVGDADYNFHEMEALEAALVSLDLPHRVERFQGAHSWMPPELAMRAIEWLELKAMQAGTRERDPALIDAWWFRDMGAARDALADARELDAARRFAAMARDYAGLRDTSAVRSEAARMMSSAAAREELKRRQADTRESREWGQQMMAIIADSFPEGADQPVRTAVELAAELEISRLKRTTARPRAEAAIEAQRRLNEIEVQLGFYLPAEVAAGDPRRANYYLSLAVQIEDRDPVSWYLLAQTYARLRAPDEAIDALERAYDAGFRDLGLLQADATFHRLRADPDFADLVTRLRTSGDTLDPLTVDRPPAHLIQTR